MCVRVHSVGADAFPMRTVSTMDTQRSRWASSVRTDEPIYSLHRYRADRNRRVTK
jgi:hypothetical protein